MLFKIAKKTLLHNNIYYAAITISPSPPNGSILNNITKRITQQQLSDFSEYTCGCELFFTDPTCRGDILEYKHIERLIEFFCANDIDIDFNISKLLKKDQEDLIFYIKLK